MVKSLKSQFKDIERNLKKETKRMVNNVNRDLKRNPINVPINSDYSEGRFGPNIHHNSYTDNSITISGSVKNSQIGGKSNVQMIDTPEKILLILKEIQNSSLSMNNQDKQGLIKVMDELKEKGDVKSIESVSFLDKHPMISMGVEALIQWGVSSGLVRLASEVGNFF